MGFCLGAQLMAKAFGARVMKGLQKEIGWYPVRLTEHGENDTLLSSFPKEGLSSSGTVTPLICLMERCECLGLKIISTRRCGLEI